MTLEDPFATAQDMRSANRQEMITGGRYRLPARDGSEHPGGWMRVTNLCGAISDQFGLRMWEIEQIFIAYAARPEAVSEDIHATLARVEGMEKRDRRGEIEDLLERCKEISGGNAGSKFGNSRHSLVEAHHLEMPLPATDAYARKHLSLYRSALERNDLQAQPGMQERRVLIESLGAVGTLDNVLLDKRSWTRHIGDLKSQKKFWTWLETAAQLACYANADAMWEPADPLRPRAGRWVEMVPVSKKIAFVLHMPREQERVDVYEVDIAAGWRTAQLCHQVIEDRAGGKSASKPRAWLREAPPVSEVELYAARFAAIETMEEGRALTAEVKAKGLWTEILAGEARTAAQRLTLTKS